ncbi:M50 family metallopeptidase [Pseudokineococcus lusitanus]|uniref:Membrane-associated protease RseP (Regulator of RpoE activity) n=1 Tax=Pseudokineococcus lusitanus TaxID=763993 RepID=A0A3N1HML3_9ACTN|nr:site-2 protease family protein [Pseudokineococcus lusitanus]ROP43711.1 membrane-associated protease RseP (regulator of RpoE activity) [Pseudokineococcus lusitanus]
MLTVTWSLATVLWVVGAVLFFVVGLAASIALHEVGHLLPAKRFGVKVTQYMVGFGSTVWSRQRGETEYGVKAVPLGGYIRMIGMFPPRPGQDPSVVRESSTGIFQTMADDARRLSAEEVGPDDAHRQFWQLSVPRRVVVMLGGPAMNALLAVLLLGGTAVTLGVAPQTTTTVGLVQECVLPAGSTATECPADAPPTPAAAAGLEAGDVVVSFDGRPVEDWQQLRADIRDAAGRRVPLVVERAGERVDLTIAPIPNEVVRLDDDGDPVLDDAGVPLTEEAGFVGFSPTQERRAQPVSDVPGLVADAFVRTVTVVVSLPVRMVDVAQAAFGSEPRDPEGPVGIVGVGRLSGEIAAIDQFSAGDKVSLLLGTMGGLNMALFVFNLLPLLPLDGGHVAGALYEGARRRVAALRRRPDPGPFDVARLMPVAYVVGGLLVAMSVLLVYADIVRPVTLLG